MMRDIHQAKILIVDDQEANVLLLDYLLKSAGYTNVSSTTDSRRVVGLYRTHQYDLIVLDLNLPYLSGFEVMDALKSVETGGYLPVLALTADPSHKLKALDAGAKDFVSKPFDNVEMLTRIHNMLEVRILYRALHNYNEELEERVQERTEDLRESYREAIYTMTAAAEHKDEDTGLHIQRIGIYCHALAEQMGLDSTFRENILYASPMHDIGKIGIPDHILLKPGPHTSEEWEIMKTHTTLGARILANKQSPYLRMGAEIALNHHERWDGSGYPSGLRGMAIPLSARIMNICDIYDALRSKRPYKPAFDHEQTVSILMNGDGRTQPEHIDPAVRQAFENCHELFNTIFEDSFR
jgi:putative two-component system response regulator